MFGLRTNFKRSSDSGFTIVELLIATTVFSVVLLLCVYGLLSIGKSYTKGVNSSKTQSVARSIVDNISEAIQYGGSEPYPLNASNELVSASDTSKNFCIGDLWYQYQQNKMSQDIATNYGLKLSKGCASPSNSKILLGKGMRIRTLTIKKNADASYSISIQVATGEDDLFDSNGNCTSNAGKQFCAISSLETTVQRRVKTP